MPTLSVVIPVFNEKDTLRSCLEKVRAVPIEKEIILVDDGSTDGTREIIRRELESSPKGLKVVYHEKNQGKGSAIRTGLREVSGDLVIIQDADLEYDPKDYIPICQQFNDPDVSVVYGVRFKNMPTAEYLRLWFSNQFFGGKYEIKELPLFMGIKFLNVLANILYSAAITDEATCYKAFRYKVLCKIELKCKGFDFCPEVTAKVRKQGYKITEVPISYHPRSKQEGKKLNWTHGFEAIATLIKYRFID